jgi:hypothetical protein
MKPTYKVALVLVNALLSGCVSAQTEREMNFTASALTKLSAAVDATARFQQLPEKLSDADLLLLSTSHEPSLLQPFANFTIRLLRIGPSSAVLICQPDGGKALLEDTGCTSKLDRHHWSSEPAAACEFTLDVKTLCEL